jgi:hypothetical protein
MTDQEPRDPRYLMTSDLAENIEPTSHWNNLELAAPTNEDELSQALIEFCQKTGLECK